MKKLLVLLALLGLATPAAAQNPFSLINFGANAVDTNSGNKSAGTLRVVFATDQPSNTNPFLVTGTGGTFPVTGTFWQATQPVSLASVPSHAVTNAGTFAVQAAQSGTWNITNVSGTVSLPTGASTAAKQPALGTAGTASSDVITVQGIASMTALKVDPSGVTSPVSGTVTANAGTGTFTVGQATGTNLHMVCDSGCSSSSAPADEATFTAGTTSQTPVGGFFQTTATSNPLTTGQMGAFQVTANRALFSNLRNASGTEVGTSATPLQVTLANTGANATAVKVDGSAVTQPISAASLPLPALAATSTKQSDGSQKTQIVDGSGNVIASTSNNLNVQCANCSGSGVSAADEATFTAGTTLFAAGGGFFQTTATSNALTTGQQGAFQVTANRALFTNLRNAAGTEVGTSAAPLQVTLANTGANATAVKVDGSAVTQPVSGTVTTTPPANASTNLAQVAGTTTDTNSGVKSAGTIRVVLATDQPALTNKLLVTPDSVALPANQSVNVSQINGVTPLMGAGATGTGAQRVNDVASSATGAAPPASAIYVAGLCSGATGGLLCGASIGDTEANVNVTTATTTLIVTGVSGRKIHVTSLRLGPFPSAQTLAWIEGTGATCGTGTAGVEGGTTAATGVSYAANGGERQGTGIGDVLATATAGDSLCLVTGSAVQTSGHLKVAIY